jgi:uncharacterized protein (DUF433 family)
MSESTAYPHIVKPPDGPAHLERYPRIRVAQIVTDYLAYGWSPDQMVRQFEHLTLSEVHAAMLYYWDHQQEIDAEIQAELEEYDRARAAAPPSPFLLRMRALGKR